MSLKRLVAQGNWLSYPFDNGDGRIRPGGPRGRLIWGVLLFSVRWHT